MTKNKKYIIAVICFFLILIIFVIYSHVNNFENHYVNNKQEKTIDLNSLYDNNSLAFDYKNEVISDIDCTYIQLDGLKKTKVENNINKKIKNEINNVISNNKILEKKLFVDFTGNFGNVLSIIFYSIENEKKQIYKTLNYNLVNGSDLQFNNLFIIDAPVLDIFNDELTLLFVNEEMNPTNKANLLQKFKENNFLYYFDQYSVNILVDNTLISIPYYKYPNYFTLHYNYLTSVSIYKNNNVGTKDILIASTRDNGIYSVLDNVSENAYVDLTIKTDEKNISNSILKNIEEIVNKENSSLLDKYLLKFVYLNQDGTINKISYYENINDEVDYDKKDYNIYKLVLNSRIYELKEDYFKINLKDDVYKLHRESNISNNFIKFDKSKKYIEKSNSWIILSNGKELQTIEDLFIDGYDYKSVSNDYIINKYQLEDIDVQNLLEDCTYTYNLDTSNISASYSIVLTTKNNKKFYVPFDYFDEMVINIY